MTEADITTVELEYEDAHTEEDYIIIPGTTPEGDDIRLFAGFTYIENADGDIIWEGPFY